MLGAVLAALVAPLPARAGRVLLLDASEPAGAAGAPLAQTADALAGPPPVEVEGAAFVASLPGEVPALVATEDIDELLDRAGQHYDAFEPDAAVATLSEATTLIAALEGSELGPIQLRFHWLSTLAEMGRGHHAEAEPHLLAIARLAPWWEPPQGYLTPELEEYAGEQLETARDGGAVVDAQSLPAEARAWVDGFPLQGGTLQVSPGRHLVRVEQPGFATVLRWVELPAGTRFGVPSPTLAAWTAVTRARVRGSMGGAPEPLVADVLTRLGRQAGVDLVVVVTAAPADTLQAAVLRPGEDGWAEPPAATTPEKLARRIRALDRPAGGELVRRPVVPVAHAAVGAGGRVVGDVAPALVAASGGPSIDVGGGISIRDRLEIRASVGLEVQAQTTLEARGFGGAVDARQRGVLGHAGVVIGPRVPLGEPAALWAHAGIGLALGWMGTAVAGGEPQGTVEPGLWAAGLLGLDLALTDALVLGPDLGYQYGGIQLYGELTGGDGTNYFYSPAFHVIRAGVHLSIRGR